MSKRQNPAVVSGGYPGLRSKRAKLAPLLSHERDYLSLPTNDSLSHNNTLPQPPVKQHHHRYDLRVRPPRPPVPKPPVNGHRQLVNREATSLREKERWRNAHSYSVNYQRLSSSHGMQSRTRLRCQIESGAVSSSSPQRKRRKQAPPNENDLVCASSCHERLDVRARAQFTIFFLRAACA